MTVKELIEILEKYKDNINDIEVDLTEEYIYKAKIKIENSYGIIILQII